MDFHQIRKTIQTLPRPHDPTPSGPPASSITHPLVHMDLLALLAPGPFKYTIYQIFMYIITSRHSGLCLNVTSSSEEKPSLTTIFIATKTHKSLVTPYPFYFFFQITFHFIILYLFGSLFLWFYLCGIIHSPLPLSNRNHI